MSTREIGNYAVLFPIAEGASSTVYLGQHKGINEEVALKVMKASDSRGPALSKREVDIMTSLDNSNIVSLYDYFTLADNRSCIVMEYVGNGTLLSLMNFGEPMDEMKAKKFFVQIVDAVDYLHKNNIIHRDIKAENVLIDNNFNVKLADFGLATKFHNLNDTSSSTDGVNIAKQTFCGSPCYVSPEVALKNKYDKATDIWSIGILLYLMTTGNFPFYDENLNKLLMKIASEPLAFPNYNSENSPEDLPFPIKNDDTFNNSDNDIAIDYDNNIDTPCCRNSYSGYCHNKNCTHSHSSSPLYVSSSEERNKERMKKRDIPISEELKDLIKKMLEKDPADRITIEQIRRHKWIYTGSKIENTASIPSFVSSEAVIIFLRDEKGINIDDLKQKLEQRDHDAEAIYRIAKKKVALRQNMQRSSSVGIKPSASPLSSIGRPRRIGPMQSTRWSNAGDGSLKLLNGQQKIFMPDLAQKFKRRASLIKPVSTSPSPLNMKV